MSDDIKQYAAISSLYIMLINPLRVIIFLRWRVMNQIYSPEIQQKVLGLYQSAIPVKEIVLRTGVSRSRVYAFINSANLPRQRKRSGPAVENESPIKAAPFMNLDVRKQLIDGFQACDNKSQFAQEHQIPRSTLYRWSSKGAAFIVNVCVSKPCESKHPLFFWLSFPLA